MIAENVRLLKNSISQERIMDYLRLISGFHRVQVSPDIQEAERACVKALKEQGVQAQILSYKSAFGIRYLDDEMVPEWHCNRAWLSVSYPEEELICDYSLEKMCLILRSASCDFSKDGLELVSLPEGADENNCGDLDLKGRIILVHGYHGDYLDWAVAKKGAVGILSDYLPKYDGFRNEYDMAECRAYKGVATRNLITNRIFGFSLKKSEADRLRRLCERTEREHAEDPGKPRYPIMKGLVDVEYKDGHICDLFAEIPGTGNEAVMAVAHICHPKPCANDNASGSSGCMEIITVLKKLIDSGALARPRRSIRILLVPEMSGSNAYIANLSGEERSRIKACVNLDMIGGKQGPDAGPVCILKTPDYRASCINQLMELVLDEAVKDYPTIFLKDEFSGMHSFEVHSYCGGSDNKVFNDSPAEIPTVSMTQWPDRFYHTSFDTPDRIDPSLIAKCSVIAAAFLYALAEPCAGDFDAAFFRSVEDASAEMASAAGKSIKSGEASDAIEEQLLKICESYEQSLSSVKAFTEDRGVLKRAGDTAGTIRHLKDSIARMASGFAGNKRA